MDYESIKADVLKELESLGLPQSEIDKVILDFDDIVTKVSDDPSLMKRLAIDLISAAKYRANLKNEVPDTIPDELIVEDIAKQETAKLNDPNVFETFIENATTDEKKMVKGLDESGKLDDVGGVKGLITDLVTQYPQTAKVIGRSLGAFLQGAATLIDPIGEAIDLGLKLSGKKPVVGGVNALKREGFTWALWQASAFGYTQIQDMGNIVNMTLDKVGLLPDWYKNKVDVPQNMEEINAEYAINMEKNRRLGNQGYKATSLWWWLDQGIPARLTGLSPIEWAIRKYEYNQFGDITDDEKKFLDIMYGYDTRMEKNKESMFGWWQNEFDTNFTKKYYNEAHINDFRKIEKIGPEFGSEGVELYNDFKELGLIDE